MWFTNLPPACEIGCALVTLAAAGNFAGYLHTQGFQGAGRRFVRFGAFVGFAALARYSRCDVNQRQDREDQRLDQPKEQLQPQENERAEADPEAAKQQEHDGDQHLAPKYVAEETERERNNAG